MPDDQPLRCISFTAVSTAPQAEEVSLEEQAAINRRNARQIGGVIVQKLSLGIHASTIPSTSVRHRTVCA